MVTIRKPVGCSGFELNRQPDSREFYVAHSKGTPTNAGAPNFRELSHAVASATESVR